MVGLANSAASVVEAREGAAETPRLLRGCCLPSLCHVSAFHRTLVMSTFCTRPYASFFLPSARPTTSYLLSLFSSPSRGSFSVCLFISYHKSITIGSAPAPVTEGIPVVSPSTSLTKFAIPRRRKWGTRVDPPMVGSGPLLETCQKELDLSLSHQTLSATANHGPRKINMFYYYCHIPPPPFTFYPFIKLYSKEMSGSAIELR
ncbi:uncharacterized protein G2W53_042509 [Senna tora]|uniref:Uncharacterized protein n=1 Tax=Senna tora TaxID=362788 RepID=A0A834SJ74_9FABA|nr:uncharacterized protein G2W53_042509 [Senna tora]